MKPIKFWIIPAERIRNIGGKLPAEFLETYLAERPGILLDDQIDLWCENCRSVFRPSRFDLFERQRSFVDADTVVVIPPVLELYHYCGMYDSIIRLLDYVNVSFHNRQVAFSWNHDQDSAMIPWITSRPKNWQCLTFNASCIGENDLALPFWTISLDPKVDHVRKVYRAGFVGYVGKVPARVELRKKVRDRPGYSWIEERIPITAFQEVIASCNFSLCPRGGGLNSYRMFESIHLKTVPVLFSDTVKLPYPDLDWESFSLRIPESAGFDEIDARLTEFEARTGLDKDPMTMDDVFERVRPRFTLAGIHEAMAAHFGKVMA